MLRTYLKVALRSLWKNKVTSIINVAGLAVGLSSCLLIALYIRYQVSYDSFQPNGSRIARTIMHYGPEGGAETNVGNFTSSKVAPVFSRTFPEVAAGIRMSQRETLVLHGNNFLKESRFLFADSTFFAAFHYKMLEGNPDKALNGRAKVVLTRSSSRKYFGDKSPVGEVLYVGADKKAYEVTGLVEDYPENSQFRFDFLASFSSLGESQEETYFDANFTTYFLLRGEDQLQTLKSKVNLFMKKEMAGSGASISFHFEPFTTIHLRSPYDAFVPNVNIAYLYILTAIGVLILVIVCFTYINISTARSVERAKEIGVRKVIGAARVQVFWQFVGESTVLCMIAVLLAAWFSFLALPLFNTLTEESLSAVSMISPIFIAGTIVGTAVVSLLAGAYPALVLSRLQPVKVLKGVFRNSSSAKWIQPSLIVFQFGIAVFLIASTMVIQQQLHFIQNKRLGYDRSHVLVLPLYKNLRDRIDLVKEQFKTKEDVLNVSAARWSPVHILSGHGARTAEMAEKATLSVAGNAIDEGFLPTAGLELVAGGNLTEQDMKDVASENWEERTYHFILNESAVLQLGWTPEESVGKKMFLEQRAGYVRGVVKDFHFESLHHPIKSLVMFSEHGAMRLFIKVKGENLGQTIASIEKQWKQLAPEMPFEFTFLDDDYNKLYHSERQFGNVMNLFAVIAIVLACVGLFGLSINVVQQRIKEIGIRKILGASEISIFALLSGTFTMLVFVSILIALPLAWVLLSKWLQEFAYRIDVKWWTFALAGLLAVVIALLTVSIQAIKSALMNPVDSLRTE